MQVVLAEETLVVETKKETDELLERVGQSVVAEEQAEIAAVEEER